MAAAKKKTFAVEDKTVEKTTIAISRPNLRTLAIEIFGTSPYVQNKFSAKAKQQIIDTQKAGSVSRGKKVREAKDFDACYRGAMHVSEDGWIGMPAPAFRNAMISACRLVGFKMTHAKLSVFIEADGFDEDDGTPLVKIEGEPEMYVAHVRNETGVVDIRARPMWREWKVKLRIRFDADQFTVADVTNLLMRVGQQVGIGEGRNDSKKSTGMGFGSFELSDEVMGIQAAE